MSVPKKGQHGFQVSVLCPNGHNKDIVGRVKGCCKPCRKLSIKKWKVDHPDKTKKSWNHANWKKQAIISKEGQPFTTIDFDRLYQIQQGRCSICNKHQSELMRPLNVDHNHETKICRGLLCDNCNKGIGLLGDSVTILESGIKYLKRGH